ncbi:MAG: hypothetical protein A2W91_05430 [Bacteroidetes bacterium GWF2_38_335]|nr:MAG: hypothetical protein A2W91_05430 [Bacteroidetes bacterium GWF2_38_335]HBS88115.1 hypothetical protein [Bacteroidales bacterium]
MRLHENKNLYKDAIRFTAQQMNLKPEYVEKDYWITFALYTVYHHEIGKDMVFKGGTALSKCYKMIDRFSEDIDLVVIRREGESNNKLTTKIRKISDIVNAVLPEVIIEGITHKMGMNRKTAHSYNKEFSGDYGQVRNVIVVEATWLGYYEPFTTKSIVSFVGSMMLNNGQTEIAQEYNLIPYDLQVLEPIRTICEKIMSLVRFSYSENPLEDLKNKIRHTYDLNQLLRQKEFSVFIDSPVFDEMLLKVAKDDVVSFKSNNEWLNYHPGESLFFKDLDNIWNELKVVYNGEFKNLVYGELPNEEEVFKTMIRIRERLKPVIWNIKI